MQREIYSRPSIIGNIYSSIYRLAERPQKSFVFVSNLYSQRTKGKKGSEAGKLKTVQTGTMKFCTLWGHGEGEYKRGIEEE